LLLLETCVLLVIARVLMRIFPNGSTRIGYTIIGLAVIAVVGNYVVRRKLRAED
jgi:purine-cytosine permease-like protein